MSRLISERDVRRAAREGATTIDVAGAVLTPSARDAATRLGVSFTGQPAGGAEERSAARAARGSAAKGGGRTGSTAGLGVGRGAPPQSQSASAIPAAKDRTPASGGAPSPERPAVAVGADHGGVGMKDAIAAHLTAAGHRVLDMGTTGTAAVDYPDFAAAVAREVAAGRARFGIMVDGAGIGSSMAANKVPGARAAMCYDVTTAVNAREHNDANVLTLGAGLIGPRLALTIVDTFLATPYAGGRHQSRVDKVNALDRR